MKEKKEQNWTDHWFNVDYMKLYTYRDESEAERQISFLLHKLHIKPKSRILDLGCGTGRHAFALARKGFSVLGIDNSKYLLEEARKQAVESPELVIDFSLADKRNLQNIGIFDVVISMFTSFGYFDTDQENWSVFAEIRKVLRFNGHFFLDFLHPYQVRENLLPYEERWVDNELVRIKREIKDNSVYKIISFPNREYIEHVKLYTREEIETELKNNRLQVKEVLNDYDDTPWQEKGSRQIFICEAV